MHIHREMAMHVDYCNSFGLSQEDMQSEQESLGEYPLLQLALSYLPSIYRNTHDFLFGLR